MPEMRDCPHCGASNSVKREGCFNCGTLLRPISPSDQELDRMRAEALAGTGPITPLPSERDGPPQRTDWSRGVERVLGPFHAGCGAGMGFVLGAIVACILVPILLLGLVLKGCSDAMSALPPASPATEYVAAEEYPTAPSPSPPPPPAPISYPATPYEPLSRVAMTPEPKPASTTIMPGRRYMITGENLGVLDQPKTYLSETEFAHHLVTILAPGDTIEVAELVGTFGLITRIYILSHNGVAVTWSGYVPTDLLMRKCEELE